MKTFITTSLALSAALLTGCGTETPACNDPTITASSTDIFAKAISKHLTATGTASADIAKFELEFPQLVSYDKDIKLRSCKATLVVTFDPTLQDRSQVWLASVRDQVKTHGLAAPLLADGRSEAMMQFAATSQQITSEAGVVRIPLEYSAQTQEGDTSKNLVTIHPKEDLKVLFTFFGFVAHDVKASDTAKVVSSTPTPAPEAPETKPGTLLVTPTYMQMCEGSEEALCLSVASSTVQYRTNGFAVPRQYLEMLDARIKTGQSVCLINVDPSPLDASVVDFDAIRESCS